MRRSGVHSVNNAVHEVGSITASKGGESESIGVLGHWGNGVLQNAKCKLQSMPLGCHCEPPPRGVATPWRCKFAFCIFHFAICNFSPTPLPHYPIAFFTRPLPLPASGTMLARQRVAERLKPDKKQLTIRKSQVSRARFLLGNERGDAEVVWTCLLDTSAHPAYF